MNIEIRNLLKQYKDVEKFTHEQRKYILITLQYYLKGYNMHEDNKIDGNLLVMFDMVFRMMFVCEDRKLTLIKINGVNSLERYINGNLRVILNALNGFIQKQL